jgi:Arc/MetJ family transcription regulator
MKTTIDIPDSELEDVMRYTGAKTKRAAILTAVSEFNRRRRMSRLVRHSGTCDFPSNEEIEALEEQEDHGSR